jgi:plastocyanin
MFRRAAFGLALTGLLLGAAGARATTANVPVVFAEYYTYFPGYQHVCSPDDPACPPDDTQAKLERAELHITQGTTLMFANLDPDAFHTVTAEHEQASSPVFDSGDPIPAGQVASVAGTETLAPGRYVFWCELHTNLMRGTLFVDAA